jgi:hypothetical protein
LSDIAEINRPKRLLGRPEQSKRYNVSTRTIERWGNDPRLNMPAEIEINDRYYRYEHELENWERSRIAQRSNNQAA